MARSQRIIFIAYVTICALCAGYLVARVVAQEPNELTEVQLLKGEKHKLSVQLAQCQINLIDRESKLLSINLTAEQSQLEEEFRAALKAGKDDKFNWETMRFEDAKSIIK